MLLGLAMLQGLSQLRFAADGHYTARSIDLKSNSLSQ